MWKRGNSSGTCHFCNGNQCWPFNCPEPGLKASDFSKISIGDDAQPGDKIYDITHTAALGDTASTDSMGCSLCCKTVRIPCRRRNCRDSRKQKPHNITESLTAVDLGCTDFCTFGSSAVCFTYCCDHDDSRVETDPSKLPVATQQRLIPSTIGRPSRAISLCQAGSSAVTSLVISARTARTLRMVDEV